ncbi:hypothetical protein [uncultured Paludibaculum sp.]|uniref:hypothetical protein n=1 Tax=uncultured Paludibaculum sp. TaxID=1765020 RepID=UPI002AAA925E|nr:hypothetical protein [uncultured Paludibaculum sp.]
MTAVADASPLCYLVLIDEVGLLPGLFDRVFIPPAVIAELHHPDAPETVRDWAEHLPSWITVSEAAARSAPSLEKAQTSERDAILLTESLHADTILLDEKSARRVATEIGSG